MRNRLAAYSLMLVTFAVLPPLAGTAAAQSSAAHFGDHRLDTLRPGAFVVQTQTIPVDVVFIGYSPDQIRRAGAHRLAAGHLQTGGAISAVLRVERPRHGAAVPLQVTSWFTRRGASRISFSRFWRIRGLKAR